MRDSQSLGVVVLSYESGHQSSMYVPALQANSKVRLVAVAETPDAPEAARAKARDQAAALGIPYREDLDTLLSEPGVGAVCLCSTLDRRLALVRSITRAGKAIFSDKPMCRTLDDAIGIVRSVEAAGVPYMIGHNYRFSGVVQRAVNAVRAGKVGLPWAIHAELLIGEGANASMLGEITNFLLYPADAVRYIAGSDYTEVYAVSGSLFFDNAKKHHVEDLGVVAFRMQHGIVGTITVGRTPTRHINGYDGDRWIRILGSHGVYLGDGMHPYIRVYTQERVRQVPVARNQVEAMIDQFVDSAIAGKTPSCNARDGLAMVQLTDAVLQAARQNTVVSLTPITNLLKGD
ncbi:MAG: Gfo/Idh/MocA family oxidoreductase [Chloroflexi bacterium]|nr:Gfo/Idh/MocA family oxidoreductase [Chloroflexota bacterium]